MKIEKNISFNVEPEDIAKCLNECLNTPSDLPKITKNVDTSILAYIASSYVSRISEEDPEQLKMFARILPKDKEDKTSTEEPSSSSITSSKSIKQDDTVFIRRSVVDLLGYKECEWDRYVFEKSEEYKPNKERLLVFKLCDQRFRVHKIKVTSNDFWNAVREGKIVIVKK